jgi:hypothetical protein
MKKFKLLAVLVAFGLGVSVAKPLEAEASVFVAATVGAVAISMAAPIYGDPGAAWTFSGGIVGTGVGIWLVAGTKVHKAIGVSLIVLDEDAHNPYETMVRAQFPQIDSQEAVRSLAEGLEAKYLETAPDADGNIRFGFSRSEVEAFFASSSVQSDVIEQVYSVLK